MLKTGVSYLSAFLAEKNEFKQSCNDPFINERIDKKRKVTEITEIQDTQKCFMCEKNYQCDKNELPHIFYELSKKPEQEFVINQKTEIKHETFICQQCEKSIISCEMCGKKFLYYCVRQAFNDPKLKNVSVVCLTCFDLEACMVCGYLGGASPCRWCR